MLEQNGDKHEINNVTAEQFIKLCKENKHKEIRNMEQLISKEAESIIHAKNDESFRKSSRKFTY